MKKNRTWIIACLWAIFYHPAQAQTGLSFDQSRSFARCLMVRQCWESGQHPNFFELNRFAPALKKFLTPADYGFLVNNQDVTFELLAKDSRLDAVVGFCPPQPNNQNFSLWDCDRMMVVSLSWNGSLKDIQDAHNKNPVANSPFEAISRGILGENGQGGKLQILYVYSPTEATYWQEGMVEKTIIKTDSDLFKGVKDACGKAPTEGPAECMQALAKAFSAVK